VVNCLSIHAAKGLEAPVVAVIGCNEGEFPKLQRGPDGKTFEMDDEEARLFYVAIPRAERYLLLTSSRARALRPGLDARSTQQARFLDWLPDATCVFRQR
jgi:DNA helicase-2/ATP-dependent DNA helicase PcrA